MSGRDATVRLVLVRHAVAADEAPSDAERALTADGRERFRKRSLPWLAAHGPYDRVLHSPWKRAAQTAEMMKDCLGAGARLEACAALARPPDAATLAACAGERVAAVGHQPWLVELAALACFGPGGVGLAGRIALRKGGALVLEGELKPGAMRWLELYSPARR